MSTAQPSTAIENCRYCLMCRHVCPVGHVTKIETLTPHGWGLTIASVRRGLLAWNEETVGALYHCADCGTCRAHCVTDQPLPDAIAAARAEVAAAGLAPASVYKLAEALRSSGNAYGRPLPARAAGQGEDALFVGDDAQFSRPAAVDAALRLLGKVGVEPVVVGGGRNSGYLASSIGFPDLARELARATLDELAASGARRLLVLSAGDFYTLGQLYDERLGLALPEGVEVVEVLPLLAERWEAGAIRFSRHSAPAPYAYVDPTHAVRVDGRHAAPRRLLEAVFGAPPRELFWSRERTHPAGSTALQFTLPYMAMVLAGARLEDARAVGAQVAVTEAPGDLALLERLAPRYGLQVRGLYELLAEQLV
jgi:Fe-S oxidoreductase